MKPGELVTGRKKLSEELGISEQTIRTILKDLKIDQLINQQPSNKGSIISILCWNDEQQSNQQTNQQSTSNQPLNKNIKNDKNNNISVCIGNKRAYGKAGNVMLTDEEYRTLNNTYQNANELIDRVSCWFAEQPLRAEQRESHYATCETFALNDKEKYPRKRKPKKAEPAKRVDAIPMPESTKKQLEKLGYGKLIGDGE